MVVNVIGFAIIPLLFMLIGFFLLKNYHKTKKDSFWAGLIIGFGFGWLLVGIKVLLSLNRW